MKNAAIAGGLTALGTFLSIYAVYHTGRLDWPECILVAGVAVLVSGLVLGAKVIKEVTDRCAD